MIAIAAALLVGSFGCSAVLTGLMRRLAGRFGLVDRPGGHKQHGRDVPLGGGVSILATITGALLAGAVIIQLLNRWQPGWVPGVVYENLPGLGQKMPAALVMLAGAAAIFALGLIDDIRPLGPVIKLLVESVIVGAVVILLQVRAAVFLPSILSAVLTVLWVVVVVNAVNFMDNMDGLAAGVVVLAGLILTAAAAANGQLFVPALLLVVVGSAGGFLVHNFPPARVFMGDSGSLVLGYFLGLLTVLTTYTRDFAHRPAAVLMPLIILAIPLYDVASVCVVRLAQGRNLVKSDRSHFSHRLLARGMTVRATLGTIYLAVVATGLAAVGLMRLPLRLAWIAAVQTLCIVGIIALLELHLPRNQSR